MVMCDECVTGLSLSIHRHLTMCDECVRPTASWIRAEKEKALRSPYGSVTDRLEIGAHPKRRPSITLCRRRSIAIKLRMFGVVGRRQLVKLSMSLCVASTSSSSSKARKCKKQRTPFRQRPRRNGAAYGALSSTSVSEQYISIVAVGKVV